MEYFTVVSEIIFKEKNYYVLVNKKCQKYFLKKLEDNSIIYPTLEEFRELHSLFSRKDVENYALRIGEKIRIVPEIISYVGGKVALIGLTSALLLCTPGCTLANETPSIEEDITMAQEQSTEDFYKLKGFEFEGLDGYEGQRFYKLNCFVKLDDGLKEVFTKDYAEFAQLTGTELSPSFEDVRKTVSDNDKIADKYKQILLEGLGNIERRLPRLDLTILNYNLRRMEIEEISEEEMQEQHDVELIGCYNATTAKIYFVKSKTDELDKFTILHECLGHACSETRILDFPIAGTEAEEKYKRDKINIHTTSELFYLQPYEQEGQELLGLDSMGYGAEEGKAETIANYAAGKIIINGPYEPEYETLRVMLETFGITIEDYINNGGVTYLNKVMVDNGIVEPLKYLATLDVIQTIAEQRSIEAVSEVPDFTANLIDFIINYSVAKLKSGEMTKEELISKFSKIFENSKYEIIHIYCDEIEDIKLEDIENTMIEQINVIDDLLDEEK